MIRLSALRKNKPSSQNLAVFMCLILILTGYGSLEQRCGYQSIPTMEKCSRYGLLIEIYMNLSDSKIIRHNARWLLRLTDL